MTDEREPATPQEPARPAPRPAAPSPAPPGARTFGPKGLLVPLAALLAVVLLVAAFVAVWWPERRRRVAVEGELGGVRTQLEEAELRVRLGALLGGLIALMDAVADRNYGQAQELSTRFFDAVRAELERSPEAAQRDALEWILGRRDTVTVAIARADPATADLLRRIQVRLRQLLGYPAATPPPVPELPAARPVAVPLLSPPPSPSPSPAPPAPSPAPPAPSPPAPAPSPPAPAPSPPAPAPSPAPPAPSPTPTP